MRAATAIVNDKDWAGPLMACHADPAEGYLHTILSSGKVLPLSMGLALVCEYPCTLGQQQPDLHERLVYSSVYGIPVSHRQRLWEFRFNIAGSVLGELSNVEEQLRDMCLMEVTPASPIEMRFPTDGARCAPTISFTMMSATSPPRPGCISLARKSTWPIRPLSIWCNVLVRLPCHSLPIRCNSRARCLGLVLGVCS